MRNRYYASEKRDKNFPRLQNLIPVPINFEISAIYRGDAGETFSDPIIYCGIYEDGHTEWLTVEKDGELENPMNSSNFWRYDFRRKK